MKLTVYIENEQEKLPFGKKEEKLIKKAIKASLKHEGFKRAAEVSVTVCDDETIHRINLEHRGIDRATDVLSFPMFDEEFEGEAAVLGDIVISLERARAQAEQYGHSFEREIAFLTVHSMLHLFGYDHEEGKAEESEMFEKQEIILKKMHLTRKVGKL